MKTIIISEWLYERLIEYFEDKSDADYEPDTFKCVPNREMRLLLNLEQEFIKYNGSSTIPY